MTGELASSRVIHAVCSSVNFPQIGDDRINPSRSARYYLRKGTPCTTIFAT
jgi:hypothetical protein